MAPSTQSEIIQEWADYIPTPGVPSPAGPYTFERGRMEKAIRKVCIEMPEEAAQNRKKNASAAGSAGGVKKVKKEDVDFLYKELLLSRTQAESALQEANGDLSAAIKKIVVS
ncbi:hypothetical protein BCV69DRAFT_280840 [Microstroma glucosiphilum]|uniref:Nascent polypeptide-associated complex subunit alpha-like UBA domain-containing protein n=1 Tax=Pseudomicrostroma glucosiphilum TaxID=1684307 RepID=A0A316UDB2_9BASI|nr:hypothetical protein BCV69DRAFT_280840 [Pseudomicrostroma glucosiphilum]PWN23227.1 hypothetical protein BCV69DRAFT_280840 [Pseudomicrostroma glucosiphilum]